MSAQPATGSAGEVPFSLYLMERLEPAVDAFPRRRTAEQWDPADRDLLRQWFLLLWQSVRASVPLLELATEQLRRWPQSPFTNLLAEYYADHAQEEEGHDEWLLDDLGALGVSEEEAFLALPNRHIAAMIGSQYYLIRHYHPALLLSYLAFSEGHPPTPQTLRNLQARSATPDQLWRTYLFHAEEDPHHLDDLCRVLDEVPLEPEPLRQAIVVNGLRCVANYAAAVDSLCSPAARPQGAQRG
jgi:hypothetical protein